MEYFECQGCNSILEEMYFEMGVFPDFNYLSVAAYSDDLLYHLRFSFEFTRGKNYTREFSLLKNEEKVLDVLNQEMKISTMNKIPNNIEEVIKKIQESNGKGLKLKVLEFPTRNERKGQ